MKRSTWLLLLIIPFIGCRKPYDPPAVTGNGSYLVVEGVINSGADSTIIKLSRTVNISSKVTLNPEPNASVAVVSDQGNTFPLTETTNGNYVAAGLNLDNSHTYRLNITTAGNKQYRSDFVPVKVTPAIDSIGYDIVTNPGTGIQIYANTHDPNNNTHYYRWDYAENWAFHSKYISYWISNGTKLIVRSSAQQITICYTSGLSSDIVLGSSAKLQQDVLYQTPIAFISSTSEKLESEYSILLHQYALTADAYTFWTNLKKNTEQLGSVFDAQPSQIEGNIHCITKPAEPVIGYLSVCTVSSKRIIISNAKLPAWVATYPYTCEEDTLKTYTYEYYNDLVNPPHTLLPTGPPPMGIATPTVFFYSTPLCVDCTVRGTTTPPPFF